MQALLLSALALGVSAQSSCGSGFQLNSKGHVTRTLSSGRTYLLHVPSALPKVDVPLVISFHGANGDSATQETLSQLSLPDVMIHNLPIIAAYPQGVPNTTAGHSATWYSAPYANTTVDDPQFVRDILADVKSHYCINPRRIYATGKSNGGGFTNYLACTREFSAIFAAFGVVSAALYPGTLAFKGCDPARPVPLLNSHGTKDGVIPYEGRKDKATKQNGVGTSTINIPLYQAQWAARNGCAANSTGLPSPTHSTSPHDRTDLNSWSCNATVDGYTVEKLGHSWPTTAGLDKSGGDDRFASFNLTNPDLLTFFTNYPLPQ